MVPMMIMAVKVDWAGAEKEQSRRQELDSIRSSYRAVAGEGAEASQE